MAKILLIEDNEDIHIILKNLLKDEYEFYSAYSGTEGLMLLKNHDIDLVLLDIMIPGKSGFEVLTELRKISEIPVIMLTALGDKKLISDYLLAGANDYVTKPFDSNELYARVLVQLRQRGKSKETTKDYKYKNISLDNDSFEVVCNEKRERLAKKEFQILLTLFNNPKKIYTKEELYEIVWQDSYIPGDNTLNTHLSNLRKKLTKIDSGEEYIETIWGLGVRLKGEA